MANRYIEKVLTIGIVVVEICTNNLLMLYAVEDLEFKYPEIAVLQTDCLGFCGLCRLSPYAIVNGKRIIGKTAEECLEKIENAIQAELKAFHEG